MKLKIKQTIILSVILASSISMTACNRPSNDVNNSTNTSSTSTSVSDLSRISPVGTVQGNLIDAVTQQPIVGAVIDAGLASATTNQNGEFVLANLPATAINPNAGAAATLNGNYEVSINLKGVTSPVNMADATIAKRYPDFSFKQAQVVYTSDVGHPLTGVAKGYQFTVGKQSATVVGTVTDAKGQPVAAGYNVTLYSAVNAQNSATGNTGQGPVVTATPAASNSGHIIGTTTTNASGQFTFANIEAGVNVVIAAQDTANTLYGEQAIKTPTEGATRTLAFQSADAVVVKSTDTTLPKVVSVTPENNSDITPAATSVIFTFSEPIKQTSVIADVSPSNPNGLYSLVDVNFTGSKPLASNLAHSLAWSADRKTLTVTLPAVGASSMYTVDISRAQPQLKDDADNAVATVVAKYTEKLAVNFTTNGGATAAAPTIALVNAASINATSLTTGAPVATTLNWLPTSGAKGYNVYRTMNEVWGATTVAHPTVKINPTALFVTNSTDTFTDATLTPPNLDYVEYGNVKQTYTYVVKAVNSDGSESAASSAVTAADVVAPRLIASGQAVVCHGFVPAANADCNANGKIINITIPFDEEMDKGSASTPANYTSAQLGTFSSATYTPSTVAVVAGALTVTVPAKVKLTLTTPAAPLPTNAVPFGYITTGADGMLQTVAGGDVVNPLFTVGAFVNNYIGQPNTVCISAAANGAVALVEPLIGDDVQVTGTATTKSVINSGPNGICQTAAAGTDVQNIPVGSGTPTPNSIGLTPAATGILSNTAAANSICVTAAANGAVPLTEVLVGDDRLVMGTLNSKSVITSGLNGICETIAAGTDVQTLTVGRGRPASAPASDDELVPAAAVVTVAAGVTDVAGNAIAVKTKYNADGTVQ